MSVSEEPANLADMLRARAKTRGNAIAFEFEGRQTSFAELDINTNRVANALKALGVRPRERIAYLGKNSDIRNIKSELPSVRSFIATEGSFARGWQDYAAWRDAQSSDDP